MKNIIPLPANISGSNGTYVLTPEATICLTPNTDEMSRIGRFLAESLRRSTGYRLPIQAAGLSAPKGSLFLTLSRLDASLGEEGYELRLEPERLTVIAKQPSGLFHGVQTIRQLFPPAIEMATPRSGPWHIPTGVIRDHPSRVWRGAMLDVARHFFKVEVVKRYIDQLAYYKFNVLHLHLTDDQGWRIMINSWPNLTKIGGSTGIDGSAGGFFTQAEYRELVDYARARFITLVPEIDMPGHTNAALASYPELNANGKAPALYTGREVGFSSLAITSETTYKFIQDVMHEIASLTPGPFIHIGCDEAHSTPEFEYRPFVERVQKIVQGCGKRCIGWEEIAKGSLLKETLVQYWVNGEQALKAVAQGNKLIMSPATKTYLDIKYDLTTHIGLNWTGSYTEVQDSYNWDPDTFIPGIPKGSVVGVEAPLWTETVANTDDLDYMIFPRLCAIAEVAWTAKEKRNWSDFRSRLASHGPRLAAMGINYHLSPQISWPEGSQMLLS